MRTYILIPRPLLVGWSLAGLASCSLPNVEADCSATASVSATVIPATSEVTYEASLNVTVQPRYVSGHAVTSMSVLGVPLTPGTAGWSATIPWQVLQPAALVAAGSATSGVATLPLTTSICDLCGCVDLTSPPTVTVDPFDITLTGELHLDLTTPDSVPWLPADDTHVGQLTISTPDLAAAEMTVTLAVTGAVFVTGSGTSTSLTLPFVSNGTEATAVAYIRSSTPGTALVTAIASEARGDALVPFVGAPTISATALSITGDGTVTGLVQSDGELLASCTWASDDAALTVAFDRGVAGVGQAYVMPLDPPVGTVAFAVTSRGLVEATTARLSCVDLYGQPSQTLTVSAAPPTPTATDTGDSG